MTPHLQNKEQCVYMYIFYVESYEHKEKYGKIYSILKALRWVKMGLTIKQDMEKKGCIKK